MSTLNVANITDGTDTLETGYVLNGSAKAHANISIAFAIQGSFNTASVVDNAAGDLSVNFTNSMSDTSYTISANSAGALTMAAGFSVSASQYRIRMFNTNASYSDRATMSSTHGDLA